METMKLEQLIQATSGLSNRKETPVLSMDSQLRKFVFPLKMVPSASILYREILLQHMMKNIMNGSM